MPTREQMLADLGITPDEEPIPSLLRVLWEQKQQINELTEFCRAVQDTFWPGIADKHKMI